MIKVYHNFGWKLDYALMRTGTLSRNELVIGCYDSRIIISGLSKEIVTKKTDESSLTALQVMRCTLTKRLSWSVGAGSVWPHAMCLDENFHLQGHRLFVAVQADLLAYDWETGAQLFRTHCHSKILSLDLRCDDPSLVAGNQNHEVVIYSARQGSLGKVLDTLQGHRAPIACVRIDQASKVIYTLGADSELCCWNVDQHVLLHRQGLARKMGTGNAQKNPWRKVELYPSKCRFEIARVGEEAFLLAQTHEHRSSLVNIESHLRFVQRVSSSSPVIWMRCIRSAALLRSLGCSHDPEEAGSDDNVLLVASQDGTIEVIHLASLVFAEWHLLRTESL